MESRLLEKEEKYRRLNAELEAKTAELMKEVQSVTRLQERVTSGQIGHCEACLKENPQPTKTPSDDGFTCSGFPKALLGKMQLLQTEMNALKRDVASRAEQCKKLEATNREVVQQRDKAQATLRQTQSRMEHRVREKDVELTNVQRELSDLRKELREAQQQRDAAMTKLKVQQRLQDDVHHARMELQQARDAVSRQQAEIKKLERHKTEMVKVFRKQMLLIDNLKRQRDHLEASKAIQYTDEQFMKLLESIPDKPKYGDV